ncbi:hypothetical protein COOONC_15951 [Cooperia oncophora]
MSSLDDDDDIIFIEETFCSSTTQRRSPLRIPSDAPGPSNSMPFCEEGGSGPGKIMRLDSYERLLNVEELISSRKSFENRRPSPLKVSEVELLDSEFQEVQCVDEEKYDELSGKRKRKAPKKKVLTEAQLQKQAEKRRKAVEREISASVKSKCEQHMYCHVSRRIFDEFREFFS